MSARRYGNLPTVFGWELWNEIDAVAGGDYMAWTEVMLPELHTRFPSNLCMQSLGSFDTARKGEVYRRLALMPGNDVAQVHRYLDLGASLPECKGPTDVMAAEAVRELLKWHPQVPVLLAESGAVEPRHTGPFKLYARDSDGIILHDVLFAPFFAGAAGPGHIWHWDQYVARQKLWRHFGSFAEVVKDLDPPAEGFQPRMLAHPRLRVDALEGKRTRLFWCRDSLNSWETELAQGQPPTPVEDAVLDLGERATQLSAARIRAYDPWNNQWTAARLEEAGRLRLPVFTRSLIVVTVLN